MSHGFLKSGNSERPLTLREKTEIAIPKACRVVSVDTVNGIILIEADENKQEAPQFKRGDFVFEDGRIIIFDSIKNEESFNQIANLYKGNLLFLLNGKTLKYSMPIDSCRFATHEEKALLISKLKENGKYWDEEKKEIVDYVWRPKVGETYFVVMGREIFEYIYRNDDIDTTQLKQFNYFKTKKLAQAALEARNELFKGLKHF